MQDCLPQVIVRRLEDLRQALPDVVQAMSFDANTPAVVAFGARGSGKSTLLERLTGFNIFRSDEYTTTRVELRLELRTASSSRECVDAVARDGEAVVRTVEVTQELTAAQAVAQAASELLLLPECGGGKGVCVSHFLRLRSEAPTLPNLDVHDLPGLVLAGHFGEPDDLKHRVDELMCAVASVTQGRAVFLAVRAAGECASTSPACEALQRHEELRQCTLGVLTKCDTLSERKPSRDDFIEKLSQADRPAVVLVEGNVAVTNSSESENREKQAKAEQEVFEMLTRDATEHLDYCSLAVLVDRVAQLCIHRLGHNWILPALRELARDLKASEQVLYTLGAPAAPGNLEGEALEELRCAALESAFSSFEELQGIAESSFAMGIRAQLQAANEVLERKINGELELKGDDFAQMLAEMQNHLTVPPEGMLDEESWRTHIGVVLGGSFGSFQLQRFPLLKQKLHDLLEANLPRGKSWRDEMNEQVMEMVTGNFGKPPLAQERECGYEEREREVARHTQLVKKLDVISKDLRVDLLGERLRNKVDAILSLSDEDLQETPPSSAANTVQNMTWRMEHFRNLSGLYSGEVDLRGQPNGFGTFFDEEGRLRYEGDWSNGKFHRGAFYRPNGIVIYDGQWLGDQRSGHGKLLDEMGRALYEGQWLDDRRHGHGTSFYPNGTVEYVGSWTRGKAQGYGTLYSRDGSLAFEGIFRGGDRYRAGKYQGDVDADGLPNGFGTWHDDEGRLRYEGQWCRGARHGHGTLFWPNGKVAYVGHWKFGDWHGDGNAFNILGELTYSGEWFLNNRHGVGRAYRDKILRYEGEWKANAEHGYGRNYLANGMLRRVGRFTCGRFVG